MIARYTDPGDAATPLIGSWSLVSYLLSAGGEDGARNGPLGAQPGGLLSYTRGGAMSAQLVAADGQPDEGTPRYVAYFGGFTVDAETKLVAHHVHGASDDALTGRVLDRAYDLNNDRLTLTAAIRGTTHALVWQRVGTKR